MSDLTPYLEQIQPLTFTEKIGFIFALLEQGEIEEIEAYQLLTAQGEPKPPEPPPDQIGTIEFF